MKTRIPSIIRSLRSTAICLALLCTVTLPAYATSFLVTSTADNGPGTLRQALSDAMDGDTIDFNVPLPATITLMTGELVVHTSVMINGPGADQLAVDGNGASRVFHISPGKTVTISGLTITHGSTDLAGGGIFNEHAMLTVSNCTLSDNSAGTGGGGIYNNGRTGGSASLEILNSTLSGNSAQGGGGIFSDGISGSASVEIVNSTVSGNSASNLGGGIDNAGPFGSATVTLSNSTLSGNSASNFGGGIYNSGLDGIALLEIGSTILNAGASGANIVNAEGTVTSDGYNLSSDDAGGFLIGTGDLINTPPMLGPLANNGGPTLTHALLPGSPAIDMGDPGFMPPPDYDQRGPGFDRVVNGRIDIGSFEVQAATVCPQPQGYWKNNPDAWPVDHLTLGMVTYSESDLLTILNTPIGSGKNADASLILAYQLIAAKLNIANGSDPAPVSATIADADALLSGFGVVPLPYHVSPSSPSGQAMTNDANALANYNNTECTP